METVGGVVHTRNRKWTDGRPGLQCKIEKFKNNLWVKYDRKQTDHCIFKSDFNNYEMKIETKDWMDEKLELFTLRTIANKTSRSTENDWINLMFVDLYVH